MAAEIDDAMRVAVRADARAADDMAAIALRDGANAARAGTTAAAKSGALQTFKNNIVSFFRGDGRAAIQSTDDAVTLIGNQKTALKSENPAAISASEKTAIDGAAAGRTAGAENLAKSKFSLPSGTTLAGVGLTAYATYSLITWQATDGKTIQITDVKRLDAQRVQITYNPPSTLGFGIRVNDTLDFSGCSSSRCTVPALGNGERVDSLIDDHNLIILKTIADPNAAPTGTPSSTSPSGSPVPAPATLSGSWGSAVVHSSFSNQFVGSVADTTALVVGSAATVLTTGVTALAPGVANALNTIVNAAAPVAGNLLGAAGGAVKQGFCAIVPFMCDTTFLMILAAVCACLILGGGAFMLISKKK